MIVTWPHKITSETCKAYWFAYNISNIHAIFSPKATGTKLHWTLKHSCTGLWDVVVRSGEATINRLRRLRIVLDLVLEAEHFYMSYSCMNIAWTHMTRMIHYGKPSNHPTKVCICCYSQILKSGNSSSRILADITSPLDEYVLTCIYSHYHKNKLFAAAPHPENRTKQLIFLS